MEPLDLGPLGRETGLDRPGSFTALARTSLIACRGSLSARAATQSATNSSRSNIGTDGSPRRGRQTAAVGLRDLRHRFPGLADGWVRFDGPAGTLPVDTAIDAMHAYLVSTAPANVGGCFEASERTGALVDDVRARVGGLFGARAEQVIFGASATALVFAYTRALARTWRGGERIVCTQLDHDSNITPWVLAATDAGAEVTVVPVDPADGSLDLADVQRELDAGGVAWVALTGASNLTGFAPDLRAAATMAHEAGARLHVDAVARAPAPPHRRTGVGHRLPRHLARTSGTAPTPGSSCSIPTSSVASSPTASARPTTTGPTGGRRAPRRSR